MTLKWPEILIRMATMSQIRTKREGGTGTETEKLSGTETGTRTQI